MTVYDVAIIGAGHNALVSACYLAKAGLKVIVLERRPVIGGAACTEEMFGGYQVDIGSSIHVLFPSTGMMGELDLARHGLEYVELDPWGFYPIRGTDKAITFYRDLDKTCDSIARVSPHDARVYRAFMKKWADIERLVWPTMNHAPTKGLSMLSMVGSALRHPGAMKTALTSEHVLREVLTDVARLLRELFENEDVRTALLWLAAQMGPLPDAPGSALILGHYGMIHEDGAYRAIGGSGMISVALGRALEAHGGEILTDAAVERVSPVTGANNGARYEVRGKETTILANTVLFGCHVQTALLELLDRDLLDASTVRRLEALKIMNGSGLMVRQAVSALPAYAGQNYDEQGVGECHHGMQLLCPSMETMLRTIDLGRVGKTPDYPPVMQMTFTAVDPGLAPAGKHLLYSWSSFPPYRLADEHWDDIAEREADKIWDVVCEYSPNMRGALIDRYIQTPLEIERKLGMIRGDVTHLEMGMDQLFGYRPLPEFSRYRLPIPGIYLTGASTHPGGGVWGASGRSAAKAILKDRKVF